MNAILPGVDAPVRDVSKSQWFTPPELAKQIVEWSLRPGALPAPNKLHALEPSAGDGALTRALAARGCRVTAVDIDPKNCEVLKTRSGAVALYCADFLELHALGRFDLVVMNPPFEGGQTEQHILHALSYAPRVVCHCPLTTLEGIKRKAALWDKVQLHRMVIHSARPKYGPKGGATAMCTVDLTLGHTGAPTHIEWW